MLPGVSGGEEVGFGDEGDDAVFKHDEAAVLMNEFAVAAGAWGGGDEVAVLGKRCGAGGVEVEPGGWLMGVGIDEGLGFAGVWGIRDGAAEVCEGGGPAAVLLVVVDEKAVVAPEMRELTNPRMLRGHHVGEGGTHDEEEQEKWQDSEQQAAADEPASEVSLVFGVHG